MNYEQRIKDQEAKLTLILDENRHLKELVKALQERNDYLSRIVFGKKSEKSTKGAEGPEARPDRGESPKLTDEEAAKLRQARELQKQARTLLNGIDQKLTDPKGKNRANIVEEAVRHRVPEGIFCNSCHTEVADQGVAHKAHEIDRLPEIIIDRTILLHRGECSCGEVSIVMPPPPRALEQTTYSAGLISWLVTQKFRYFFPIHRMEQYLNDHGLFISRQVLNGLVNRAATALLPIANRVQDKNRDQSVLHCDESPVCVVLEESQKRYLWCVLSSLAVSFTITEKRNREEACKILGSEADIILTDGLNIYSSATGDAEHANCMAHLRRLFFNAILSFPVEAMSALDLIVEVYRIEGQAKEDRLTPDERLTLRQARSAAIMNKLRVLIESLNPPPRSSLGKAKNYAIKRWKELTVFLRDGRVEIDNNAVEREFKLAKLGFKNFMFCQSEVGCDAVATFYTLIATCKIHNVSIEPYFADVLLKLEAGWPQSRIDELLPWNWQPSTLKPSRRQMSDGTYEEDILAELVIERRNLDGNVYLKSQRGPPAEPIQSDSPTR